MRPWQIVCSGLALLLIQNTWAQSMPKTELTLGMYRIEAEVAATEPAREVGLMFRKSMQPYQGMLFVFDGAPQKQCMWMKNTFLPLSVAFLDDEGKIINIEDMQPQTENSHCSKTPSRYALEMNLGWFKSKAITEGTKIEGVVPKKREQ